jgi:hypothetical protein
VARTLADENQAGGHAADVRAFHRCRLPPNFFLDPLLQHRYDKEEDVSYLKMAASRSLFENQTADGP